MKIVQAEMKALEAQVSLGQLRCNELELLAEAENRVGLVGHFTSRQSESPALSLGSEHLVGSSFTTIPGSSRLESSRAPQFPNVGSNFVPSSQLSTGYDADSGAADHRNSISALDEAKISAQTSDVQSSRKGKQRADVSHAESSSDMRSSGKIRQPGNTDTTNLSADPAQEQTGVNTSGQNEPHANGVLETSNGFATQEKSGTLDEEELLDQQQDRPHDTMADSEAFSPRDHRMTATSQEGLTDLPITSAGAAQHIHGVSNTATANESGRSKRGPNNQL